MYTVTADPEKVCTVCGISKSAMFFHFHPKRYTGVWSARIKENRTLENTRDECIVCKGNGKRPVQVQNSLRKW